MSTATRHSIKHAAHGGDSFSSRIAVVTAVLATIGATCSYLGGATRNDAATYKNDAAIRKTAASNQWNYYQAKSNRQNLAELVMSLPGVDQQRYKAEVERYKSEKEEIRRDAEKLEAQSTESDKRSAASMHQHHRWALAGIAVAGMAWLHLQPSILSIKRSGTTGSWLHPAS